MNREEASFILANIDRRVCDDELNEALDMAIKALEQEPCEDAISRAPFTDSTICEGFSCNECSFNRKDKGGCILEERVKDLPSVQTTPKTGHWIEPQQDDGMSDPIYYQVRCSECGFDLDPQTWHMELHQYGADKFCPKCGCRMVEPQESEEE